MKIKKWLMHAIFECEDCGKTWEWYLTAQRNARLHAKKHGHFVRGETGYCVEYDGRSDKSKRSVDEK